MQPKQVKMKLVFANPEELLDDDRSQFNPMEGEDWNEFIDDLKINGMRHPILAQKDMKIIDGRDRKRGAIFLGWDSVPVIQILSDLSPQKLQEYVDKSNILRKQMSYEDKKAWIKKKYWDLIKKRHKGNRFTGKKMAVSVFVSKRTGIPEGTCDRIIADLRKEEDIKKLEEREYSIPNDRISEGVKLLIQYEVLEREKNKTVQDFDKRLSLKKQAIEKIAPIGFFKKRRKKMQKGVKIDD